MAREQIDLKSVKKLNGSGKPKKKSSVNKKFSKPQIVKNNKEKVPEEWLYMNANSTKIENVKVACEELGYDVQYWSELGVIELTIDDTTLIDMESIDDYEVDSSTTDYIKNNKINLTMIVTVKADKMSKVKSIMKNISEKTKGFFCVDDGNFKKI